MYTIDELLCHALWPKEVSFQIYQSGCCSWTQSSALPCWTTASPPPSDLSEWNSQVVKILLCPRQQHLIHSHFRSRHTMSVCPSMAAKCSGVRLPLDNSIGVFESKFGLHISKWCCSNGLGLPVVLTLTSMPQSGMSGLTLALMFGSSMRKCTSSRASPIRLIPCMIIGWSRWDPTLPSMLCSWKLVLPHLCVHFE